MDWFERLTGFAELGYDETRRRLHAEGGRLHSKVNGRVCATGTLELPSLADLRAALGAGSAPAGRTTLRLVVGDVRAMHGEPAHAGALFQVASQFNLLEMVAPDVTPEQGVTGYEFDATQGPACAIAAGAATVYRNYFAPVGGGEGQTATRQIDALADLGAALGRATGLSPAALWTMTNGYALCSADGLRAIQRHLDTLDESGRDALRARLRIGLHRDVEVTDLSGAGGRAGPLVSQAFCSALPVAYSRVPAAQWEGFARLVLEAAYEATLCAGALNARRGGSPVVLLTRLGGGAFGNDDAWIDAAIVRALAIAARCALDVRLVCRSEPSPALRALVRTCRQALAAPAPQDAGTARRACGLSQRKAGPGTRR